MSIPWAIIKVQFLEIAEIIVRQEAHIREIVQFLGWPFVVIVPLEENGMVNSDSLSIYCCRRSLRSMPKRQ